MFPEEERCNDIDAKLREMKAEADAFNARLPRKAKKPDDNRAREERDIGTDPKD